ncbi:MAG: hypothetical protein EH225_06670 [Calditrichaeota bacterium]|nr:hypothetical protein [Calditrichota bacterium]RQW03850.1 MAG: hypothetical protein EH225_06670 [Calditrichota bacterium]
MQKYILFDLIFIILFFNSCRNPFAPSLAEEDASHSRLITQQKNPEEVLINFRYAYTFKDSLVYSEVLDSTFLFKSIDYNTYPPKPIEWGRDTELQTTGGMFRYFRTLDVVWNTISPADTVSFPAPSEQSQGYLIEHYITFTLTLDGGRDIPPLNGEVLFQFIQRGQRYYISFWEDLKI